MNLYILTKTAKNSTNRNEMLDDCNRVVQEVMKELYKMKPYNSYSYKWYKSYIHGCQVEGNTNCKIPGKDKEN
jgi:hypothetical protein